MARVIELRGTLTAAMIRAPGAASWAIKLPGR